MNLLLTLALALAGQSQGDPYASAKALVHIAQEWKPGASMPLEFRRFRESEGCFGLPTDTSQLLAEVANRQFLVALVLEPGVEDSVSEQALARALYLVGPTRTFSDLRRSWPPPGSSRATWLNTVASRMDKRHVVVDGLFISESDMSPQEATHVLDRIESDLRRGLRWDQVYTAYSSEFGYDSGPRTKIGNLGSFVVFDDPALQKPHRFVEVGGAIEYQGDPLPRHLGWLAWLPASHVQPILRSRASQILRLKDPDRHDLALYQVREVYEGKSRP